MKINSWLTEAIKNLNSASINTAKLDAEIMLATLLGKERSWIHAHPEHILQRSDLCKLDAMVKRRASGESIAYIIGRKEFYGRDFIVNRHVLVPRPESESFIELLRPLIAIKPPQGVLNVLDLGAGSGCLAITTKLEFPHLNVYATDTSKNALINAMENSKKYQASINFKVQNLLTNDKEGYDVIMANLPYVPDNMQDPSIMHEPKEALFSGNDGLRHYKKLFEQLQPKHIRYVMTESLLSQHSSVTELAKTAGYTLTQTDGLVQLYSKPLGQT